MSEIQQELSNLGSEGQSGLYEGAQSSSDISQVVQDAMQQAFQQKENQIKERAYEKDRNKQEIRSKREQQSIQEASQPVVSALKNEMEKDKNFAHLIEDSKTFPEDLIRYCAETAEPEEAPGIIRELANNEEYRRQLERADTKTKMRKLISKIRKDVLTGGKQGRVPAMLQKSIPQFNPNNSNTVSADSNYYQNVARRHGI